MTIIAFNRYWVIRWHWVFFNFLAVSFLLGLSLWQWQRAEEKYQTLSRITDWQSKSAVNIANLLTIDATQRDGVQLDFWGRWLSPRVWLLDNKMVDGRVGYDVVIAVEDISLPQGSPAVLVNLGWITAPYFRNTLPVFTIPETLHIQGIFRTATRGVLLGKNIEDNGIWPMRIQQVDTATLSGYINSALISGLVYQEGNSPFAVHYRPVVLPPERHRAYALQWFLLAVAVVIIGLAASAHKKI